MGSKVHETLNPKLGTLNSEPETKKRRTNMNKSKMGIKHQFW